MGRGCASACGGRPCVDFSLQGALPRTGPGISLSLSLSLSLSISLYLSLTVIGADRRRSGPSWALPKGVPQGHTESEGIVLAAICWATSAQRRCHPQEALYLPTFSHLFDCQQTSLSLSLSLSLTHSPACPNT
jgi:hypothetical protein